MKYRVLMVGLLALGLSVVPAAVGATTLAADSVEAKYRGHLGRFVDGETEGVPKGSIRSYTLRLVPWPAGVTSLTVLIENKTPELAYVHRESVTFTADNHRKRNVKVTGLAEGTVTLDHTIQNHPDALTDDSVSLTFDVEAGRSQACTYERVKRSVLKNTRIGDIFSPGKLDSACLLVDELNGGYTSYAYPFEAFEYVDTVADHYSWAVIYVSPEDKVNGVALKNRKNVGTLQTAGGDLLAGILDGTPEGESFWEHFEGRNLRKSSCGFSAVERLITSAYSTDFDGTLLGWDRGCLDEERGDWDSDTLRVAQEVVLTLTYKDSVYSVFVESIQVSDGKAKFLIAKAYPNSKALQYDNQAFYQEVSVSTSLDNGRLEREGADGLHFVSFLRGTHSLPTIARPSPFVAD